MPVREWFGRDGEKKCTGTLWRIITNHYKAIAFINWGSLAYAFTVVDFVRNFSRVSARIYEGLKMC